jgi:hypothetical protein
LRQVSICELVKRGLYDNKRILSKECPDQKTSLKAYANIRES